MLLFSGRCIRTAIVACLIAALAASTRAQAADTVVTVATILGDPGANAFDALDMRFFKNVGLDVHFTILTNAPAAVAAVSSGSADVGITNVATLAAARDRGLALRFIAPAAIVTADTQTDLLMVPLDSSVQTGADLDGKTIAIPGIKSFQQVHVSAWIDEHGGDSKTVKFVEIPFPVMGQALSSHRVDAALLTEPFTTAAKPNARSLGSVLQAVPPPYMLLGWVATEAWTSAHPDIATKFAAAIRLASVWANSHHKESAAILIKYSQMNPALADAMARSTYGTDLSAALIAPAADASLKYGIIDKKVVPTDLIWHPSPASK